jgi:hypothetical protein
LDVLLVFVAGCAHWGNWAEPFPRGACAVEFVERPSSKFGRPVRVGRIGGQVLYNERQFDDIIASDADARPILRRSAKWRTAALPLLIVGIVGLFTAMAVGVADLTDRDVHRAVEVAGVAGVAGMVGIFVKAIGDEYRREAIDLFNTHAARDGLCQTAD